MLAVLWMPCNKYTFCVYLRGKEHIERLVQNYSCDITRQLQQFCTKPSTQVVSVVLSLQKFILQILPTITTNLRKKKYPQKAQLAWGKSSKYYLTLKVTKILLGIVLLANLVLNVIKVKQIFEPFAKRRMCLNLLRHPMKAIHLTRRYLSIC